MVAPEHTGVVRSQERTVLTVCGNAASLRNGQGDLSLIHKVIQNELGLFIILVQMERNRSESSTI